jgi:hypothetical protein
VSAPAKAAPPGRSPADLVDLLLGALGSDPSSVSLVDARGMVYDSARANGKRPASLTLLTTDEAVLSLRGPEAKAKHLVMVVAVRMDVVRRLESPIVLPGEVVRG